MNSENPYKVGRELDSDSATVSESHKILVSEFSEETRGNLGLTSKILKMVTVIAVIFFSFVVLQTLATFRFIDTASGWTSVHTLVCIRIVIFAPGWLFLAWMFWRYSRSLDRMRKNGVCDAEAVIEQQAKLWLTIGLLILISITGAIATLFLTTSM